MFCSGGTPRYIFENRDGTIGHKMVACNHNEQTIAGHWRSVSTMLIKIGPDARYQYLYMHSIQIGSAR